MNIPKKLKDDVKSIHQWNIPDDTFKKLVDNSFSILANNSETCNMCHLILCNPDSVKETFSILLHIITEFVRHDTSADEIKSFLTDCDFTPNRIKRFVDLYELNKRIIITKLGNIGSHLPHVVDASWKIDYIVKASNSDQSGGPIFRLSLSTSKHNEAAAAREVQQINFSCNSQELQDLISKLKDAVRHCQRLTME